MSEDRFETLELMRPSHRPLAVPGYQPGPISGPSLYIAQNETGETSMPLSHYLWILRRHLWKIALFVVAMLIATAVVSLRLTPIYESTATIYVDRQEAKGVVGQDSQSPAYSNVDAEVFLASQIRLIQSDSVVRPIARRYHLLEREKQIRQASEEGRAQDAPILLKQLKVTRPQNTYLLQVSYRSTDPQLSADVANQVAQKYKGMTCEQLWAQKSQPKSAEAQRVIGLLKNDPAMRTEFMNRVAGPIANKMFDCGMIP